MFGGNALWMAAQIDGIIPKGTRINVFREIYWAFLILGTVVGVVVVAYMLYNAWKYRDHEERPDDEENRPQLGEIPSGGGKGRKLALSFLLSAVIVISLITWTYFTLLYVEQPAAAQEQEPFEVTVTGEQFRWQFTYPNGNQTYTELRVPANRRVELDVTSADVFHNFGVPALRAKADAMPGHTTETWFIADETGEYQAHCFELCGAGHSAMKATVIVMEPDEFQAWYANTTSDTDGNASNSGSGSGSGDGGSGGGGSGEGGSGSNGGNNALERNAARIAIHD